jgi:hypothetical protein
MATLDGMRVAILAAEGFEQPSAGGTRRSGIGV